MVLVAFYLVYKSGHDAILYQKLQLRQERRANILLFSQRVINILFPYDFWVFIEHVSILK